MVQQISRKTNVGDLENEIYLTMTAQEVKKAEEAREGDEELRKSRKCRGSNKRRKQLK